MPDEDSPFAPIEEAVAAIAAGELVVVVDDEDRENEGDLIMAAEHATTEKMAFIIRHTSGLICAPLTNERATALDLPLMVEQNTESMRTAFTVSVDLVRGTTTGISAADRGATVRALADERTTPLELARPGHVFPLRAREGGVLKRAGHTEASVDLCKLAGLAPVAVICELVNDDGTMARLPRLREFARQHGLVIISIADLIRYRHRHVTLVSRVGAARIPTQWGDFQCIAYRSTLDDSEHVAMVHGDVRGREAVLVRVHSECLTGDLFGSYRCDCGVQLHNAMARIASEGHGVLVYLRGHEGRGIGIGHKLRAYQLQERGVDTVDANLQLGLPVDSREYGIGAQILNDLGVTTMRLLTNTPHQYGGLEGFGLRIVERVPHESAPNPENLRYLRTKREKLGHLLTGLDGEWDADEPGQGESAVK
jgi:3,4-dihydroxy 2-butanone 4-phosphate synthase/GTP cyclohydrolase II